MAAIAYWILSGYRRQVCACNWRWVLSVCNLIVISSLLGFRNERVQAEETLAGKVLDKIAALDAEEFHKREEAHAWLAQLGLDLLWGLRDSGGRVLKKDPGAGPCAETLKTVLLAPLLDKGARGSPELQIRVNRLRAAFRSATRRHHTLFLAGEQALKIQETEQREDALREVLEGLVNDGDAQDAAVLAERMTDEDDRDEWLIKIAGCMAREDPPGALAFAERIGAEHRDDAWPLIAGEWTRKDRPAARKFALSIADEEARDTALQAVAEAAAESDPAFAAEICGHIQREDFRSWSLGLVATAWFKQEPKKAAEVARTIPVAANRALQLSNLAMDWAEQDLVAALELARTIDPGADRDRALKKLAVQSSLQNRTGASEILNQIQDPKTRASAEARIVQRAAPAAAGALAAERALSMKKGAEPEALRSALRTWSREDPKAAADWTARLHDEETRQDAIRHLFEFWAARDPQAAAQKALELSGRDRDFALSSVVHECHERDIQLAVKLIRSIGWYVLREEPCAWVAEEWVKRDLKAAIAWATALPPDRPRAYALHHLMAPWAAQDPQAALRFALTVEAEEYRAYFVFHPLVRGWARRDFHAAQAWVDSLADPTEKRWAAAGLKEQEVLQAWGQGGDDCRAVLKRALKQKTATLRAEALMKLAEDLKETDGEP